MTFWLDAQLPPQLARWITENLHINAIAVRDLGLRDATDQVIFQAAKKVQAVLISKDSDFVELVIRNYPPPQLIWLTCGNVSNTALQTIFADKLLQAKKLLDQGDAIVQIG